MKRVFLAVGSIVLVLLAVLALGGMAIGLGRFGFGGVGMMRAYGVPLYGFGLLGIIVRVAFWALLIVGIVLLVSLLFRSTARGTFAPSIGQTPLDILKERYARGEINKDQFEAMRKDVA